MPTTLYASTNFSGLRAEGLQLLGKIATSRWTDFNDHDPGVTILEQLCYALTDLGYRVNHPTADLFARRDAADLPGPAAILTGAPVTGDDLRRAALGLAGVANVWLEEAPPELPLYYHAASRALRLGAADVDDAPLAITGCQRLLVHARGGEASIPALSAHVHQGRLLGEDLAVQAVSEQVIGLEVAVEVGPIDDPASVVVEILESVERYLAPPARFESYASAAARGLGTAELFEGPALPAERGFVRELPAPRRTLHESDLVRVVGAVRQVRAVRKVRMKPDPEAPAQRWVMELRSGAIAALPKMAPGSGITLYRANTPLSVDPAQVQQRLNARRAAARATLGDMRSLDPPAGRDRAVSAYPTILRQFPAAYGLRPAGLAQTASPARRAQALQLEAYLHLFDQVTANSFMQLEHAAELFSVKGGSARSYFAQPVEDLQEADENLTVHHKGAPEYRDWLETAVEPADPLARRSRFLNHLLARFAEEVGYPLRSDAAAGATREPTTHQEIAQKESLLQQYPRLSGARGSGCDVLGSPDSEGALHERLRLKLGLPPPQGSQGSQRPVPPFLLLEHLLLRPLPEDAIQASDGAEPELPFLEGVPERDPWSGRITFVFPELPATPEAEVKRRWVADTLLAETPAHLLPHLLWYGSTEFAELSDAWREFRTHLRAYRKAMQTTAGADKLEELKVRDARDRVWDLLCHEGEAGTVQHLIGRSYPLRDLPVPERLTVAPGETATVQLKFSQVGVRYWLVANDEASPKGQSKVGTGDRLPLEITAPAGAREDESYRIRAAKLGPGSGDSSKRQVWLTQTVQVQRGIATSFEEPFVIVSGGASPLPALQPGTPGDARLADFGASLELRLPESQPGVTYEVVDESDGETAISNPANGNSEARIFLPLNQPATVDRDLRVRGRRRLASGQELSVLMAQRLHVRVRANEAVEVRLDGPAAEPFDGSTAVVPFDGSTAVRVAAPQPGVQYRVYQEGVRSRDYWFPVAGQAAPSGISIASEVGGLTIRPPARRAAERVPTGLALVGELTEAPEGGLTLAVPGLRADTVLTLQATKQHAPAALGTEPSEPSVASSVWLREALAVAVRPNAAQPLQLSVAVREGKALGPWRVSGGQAGVLYQLLFEGKPVFAQPAYFHRLSDAPEGGTKGVGELRIGVDLAIARSGEGSSGAGALPPDPLVEGLLEVPAGAALKVTARHALTGLEVELTEPPHINWRNDDGTER